ncbi:DUF6520 family protein [Chitinophaga niabensis]|uniref:NVEALA protein n=1 Tax=Chitinophaga niabensis TaxID=536979 RepID=A0A1N6KAL5_9BACT|nr:DUF6520 family protein [Chitinophaga niabensis]SIO53629.1 hypothetical protein SAMN04488055_5450 [Chitinophaga niabensis]
MKKKTIILFLSTFLTAISGAFASYYFISAPGYTSWLTLPAQEEPCVYRRDCDGGQFVCKASFMIGGTLYYKWTMYGLNLPTDPTECTIPLSMSTELD